MKRYIKKIQKKLLKLKKSRSISRSDEPSFSSRTCSDSSESPNVSKKSIGLGTPTSVLPSKESNDINWIGNYIISNDFVDAFQMMDRDGDGIIDKEELRVLLSRVGGKTVTDEDIKLMLTEVDRGGDGCISLQELSVIIGSALERPTCDDELRETFDFFDGDHDGKISAEELFNVFETIDGGRCTLDDCKRMIKSVDTNMNGFVGFEDFTRMMELQLKT